LLLPFIPILLEKLDCSALAGFLFNAASFFFFLIINIVIINIEANIMIDATIIIIIINNFIPSVFLFSSFSSSVS